MKEGYGEEKRMERGPYWWWYLKVEEEEKEREEEKKERTRGDANWNRMRAEAAFTHKKLCKLTLHLERTAQMTEGAQCAIKIEFRIQENIVTIKIQHEVLYWCSQVRFWHAKFPFSGWISFSFLNLMISCETEVGAIWVWHSNGTKCFYWKL